MPITTIKKRDGSIVDFNREKIEKAIEKAAIATRPNQDPSNVVSLISDDVVRILNERYDKDLMSEEFYSDSERPEVEEIQDIVEVSLIDRGYVDIARSFIIYRAQHRRMREEEQEQLLEKVEHSEISVTKRDGSKAPFDTSEIKAAVMRYTTGFESLIDVDGIVRECKLSVFDGIKTSEINQAIVLILRSKIEADPAYSKVAARFLFNSLYKDIMGTDEMSVSFANEYKETFRRNIKKGVEVGRLDERLLEFDLEKLSEHLQLDRDHLYGYLGAQTLADRYFLKDPKRKVLELPQAFWMRVSMGLALAEDKEKMNEKAIDFYNIISSLFYVPSTPTLFHSGTTRPQMSSCYLNTVEDDLKHIFKVIGDNAQLSKWSGGIGTDWSNIRSVGSLIKSINVESQGVIAFLKVVDATTASINRSGKRRGATCVYLETWHYEIEDFLDLRKNTGDERRRTHDINTSNWIPDLFMKRVREDGDWSLFSPHETPELHHIYGKAFEEKYAEYERKGMAGELEVYKRLKARDLWKKMLSMLFATGHPWITFKDPANIRSPQDHVGVVHSSNLCTEITLNTSRDETAVCNLGSINVEKHITADGRLDKDLLANTVSVAMRMLDNVVDLNFYPTPEAENSNLKHRPVGLGIMGLQNAFYKMGLGFEDDRAVEFSDELMEFISYHSIYNSSQLAKERGSYESYAGSKWDRGIFPVDTISMLEAERGISTGTPLNARLDWQPVREHVKEHGMRNSNCMAIAPTATISNIAGCYPSIEPIYKNIYVKSNQAGEFTIINSNLVDDLRQLSLWTPEMAEKLKRNDGSVQEIAEVPDHLKIKYKEVFEVDPYKLIEHAVRRGKWIDQSQSLNFFTRTLSGSYLADLYMKAWEKGLKTTYYLRTLAASQVDKATIDQTAAEKDVPGSTTVRAPSVVPNMAANPVPAVAPDVASDGMSRAEAMQMPELVANANPSSATASQGASPGFNPTVTEEPEVRSAPALATMNTPKIGENPLDRMICDSCQ